MDQLNHKSYYLTRASKSRALAQRATDHTIAAIHSDLAKRYDMLATQMDRNDAIEARG